MGELQAAIDTLSDYTVAGLQVDIFAARTLDRLEAVRQAVVAIAPEIVEPSGGQS